MYDLIACQTNRQEELIHVQGRKIQEQGEMIDGLNTQSADVLSSLAERIAKLEGVDQRRSDSINTLNQHVLQLCMEVYQGMERAVTLEQRVAFLESKISSLEGRICRCNDELSDSVSPSLGDHRAELIAFVGGDGRT